MLKLATIILFSFATVAIAEDVPLPRQRPAAMESSEVPAPRDRPADAAKAPTVAPKADSTPVIPPTADGTGAGPVGTAIEITPPAPPRDYQVACPAVFSGQAVGKNMPPIHEGQCGIQSPLALSAVTANGREVPFSSTITTDCGMATALPQWIAEVDSYLSAHDKTRIATINVSTNYECRNVNHSKTGNLSFHAFADALDIMGFTLEDGRTISISPGWTGTPEQGSQILRFARDAACAHFTTVLGPDADAEHQDNMHLDLACHGKTCTTRMCQ